MSILYFHPESESLFWSESKAEGDGLLAEVGESPAADRDAASSLFALHCALNRVEDPPPFDRIYKEPDRPAPAEAAPAEGDELGPPRWPGGPAVCVVANLPAFETRAEMAEFDERTCGEHAPPTLAWWACHACGKYHAWHGPQTDSNGQFPGGGNRIPPRVAELVAKSAERWLSPSAATQPPERYPFRGERRAMRGEKAYTQQTRYAR